MIKSILNAVSESVRPRAPAPMQLPIFPLASILFPGGNLSLRIFEHRYMEMAKACLKKSAPFGVALIRRGEEVGAPADPEQVGTVARIVEWDMQELGILQIRVRGESRFRLAAKSVTRSGLIIGELTLIPDDLHVDCPELPPCAAFLRKVLVQTQAEQLVPARFDDANWVSFRITELLPFNNAVKQKMLELTDARMRIEVLHRFLSDQRLIA
ncbi:MAG: LON peptidase substrate-binding domain-containing protein [Betaproteobacteria bacterium]